MDTVSSGSSVERDSDAQVRAWWTAVVYIVAVAMFLRFYDLALKPLHHDEGVNTLLLTRLVQPPHAYRYDPANYHGPTLYYFSWISVGLLGLTTVAVRAATAFAGLLAVLCLLPLRRHIGSTGALAAATLLALSPGAVYFSRYYIHEMVLVCSTIAAVVAATVWWYRGGAAYLLLAGAAAGVMFATKETAVISAVVVVGAAIGSNVYADLRRHGWSAAAMRFREAAGGLRTRRAAVPLVQGLFVFLLVNLFFYTSMFSHWDGAVDAVKTFSFWTRTGTSAHTRPWHTHLAWLAAEEIPLLIAGGAGAILALWRSDNRFAIFAALWAAGTLAVYSIIPYKTPWLSLNAVAPLAIVGGYGADVIWRSQHALARRAAIAVAAVLAAVAAYQSVVLNFVEYDNGRHPYVYVHTSREIFDLLREIDRYEALNPGSAIAVTSRDHFPLSWYLRPYRAGYYGSPTVTGDPLVIASEDQAPFHLSLADRYHRVGSYSLRPGVQLVLYARRDLRRPPGPPSME